MMWRKVISILSVYYVLSVMAFNPPVDDVVEALRSICTDKFLNDQCPYAIAYDIATQLASQWYDEDGRYGLWSNRLSKIWWQSGVGLWAFAEFFNTVNGQATDKLYLATRWAAIETAKHRNNYVHTDYTDDQAWWANGALRLEQYIRSTGDATVELLNAAQAVINDNLKYETNKCGGGIYWYHGDVQSFRTAKTTISNVLTIFAMATMFSFTHDETLLHGGIHGGAIDIYNWLLSSGLLNAQTGYQKDTLDTANNNCTLVGGSLTYEYGVLVQALIALENATGNQQYITDATVFIYNAIKQFTLNNIIYEKCDQTNSCQGDQLAFRGVFYQGLGRLYERTKDDVIANVIESSYLAMLERKNGSHYPLSLINDNNNFTGYDQIVVTIGDLNLVSSMIKVYENKYTTVKSKPNIDNTIHGLLPFDLTKQGLTACVCIDYGCPRGHAVQCFNNSGHKIPASHESWKNKISAILIAPEHQMKLFDSKDARSSDWLQKSLWYVGDEFNKKVDSIDIDY